MVKGDEVTRDGGGRGYVEVMWMQHEKGGTRKVTEIYLDAHELVQEEVPELQVPGFTQCVCVNM